MIKNKNTNFETNNTDIKLINNHIHHALNNQIILLKNDNKLIKITNKYQNMKIVINIKIHNEGIIDRLENIHNDGKLLLLKKKFQWIKNNNKVNHTLHKDMNLDGHIMKKNLFDKGTNVVEKNNQNNVCAFDGLIKET